MIGPHNDQPVLTAGKPLEEAVAAMVLVHGRNASADNILTLTDVFDSDDFAYLAPSAAGHTWYPYSFMADTHMNEPGLSSGLEVLSSLVNSIVAAGIPTERILLAGFSQGACLTCEFSVRNPARYGGVVAYSGGLIGPPGTSWRESGDFADTPVFLGCSDIDPHIPGLRVQESADVFRRMGADVTLRLYTGMGHTVNDDEVQFTRSLMAAITDHDD